jgi:hypothetical protein
MKRLVPLALLLAPTVLFAHDADDFTVHWNRIVGVITATNVDNPVAGISAGTLPWTTGGGYAHVNLATGEASFNVEGLVLIGGNATGTPGPINEVTGTLVCNPGTGGQKVLNSAPVGLSPRGNAHFNGQISGIPAACGSPLFLVRIGPNFPAAAGRWLATGAGRVIGDND